MQITHVFSTHATLQERLTEAIIQDEGIDPAAVLVIQVRGSYRPDALPGLTVVDGGRYSVSGGYNVIKHRNRNRAAYELFDAEVLQRLAPDFKVYSAMYTYWFLRLLKERSSAYHILEDGFGSYQTKAEQREFFQSRTRRTLQSRLVVARRWVCQLPAQRRGGTDFEALLDDAAGFYATSAACFPFADGRRRVVSNPFPPKFVGEFNGATVLGTSCFVESGYMSLSEYEQLLATVLEKIAGRGITAIYHKWHPAQVTIPENYERYQLVIASFASRIKVTELAQGTSIESLAAGNDITFITGASTLAFHVEATGATVLTYLSDIEAFGPQTTSYLAKSGLEIFRRITQPL